MTHTRIPLMVTTGGCLRNVSPTPVVNKNQEVTLTSVDIRTPRPIESFYKNLFESNRIGLEARPQQTEENAFQKDSLQLLLCIWRKHKGGYMKAGESKVGTGLRASFDYVLSRGWFSLRG